MGTYLNPGNSGFRRILGSEYVDKTGLIGLDNRIIGTAKSLTCICRPRRFGKSYAAQMLCAYYDKTCDSYELFEGLSIAKDDTYEKHLNQYNVIYLDIAGFKPYTDHYWSIVPFIIDSLKMEILVAEGFFCDQTIEDIRWDYI